MIAIVTSLYIFDNNEFQKFKTSTDLIYFSDLVLSILTQFTH